MKFIDRQRVVDKIAMKQLKKLGIGTEITAENVAKAAKQLSVFLDSMVVKKGLYSKDQIRINVTTGMMGEINMMRKNGMSNADIENFYWNIPEFQEAWAKLGFEREQLSAIINM